MLFKKSERRHMNPYVTVAVGTLAVIGMVSIVKCGKKMISCTCDKMSCMVKQIMGKSEMSAKEE